jgi:hypothetical protein
LCAHVFTLLAVLVVGYGLMDARPALATGGPDESVVPESGGGGGGYGDPDQPQEPPKSAPGSDPGYAPGGDPEYSGYTPESETSGGYGFEGARMIGRNYFNVWKWRVRFLIAGMRFSYLRF